MSYAVRRENFLRFLDTLQIDQLEAVKKTIRSCLICDHPVTTWNLFKCEGCKKELCQACFESCINSHSVGDNNQYDYFEVNGPPKDPDEEEENEREEVEENEYFVEQDYEESYEDLGYSGHYPEAGTNNGTMYACWIHEPISELSRFVPQNLVNLWKYNKTYATCSFNGKLVKKPSCIWRQIHYMDFQPVLKKIRDRKEDIEALFEETRKRDEKKRRDEEETVPPICTLC